MTIAHSMVGKTRDAGYEIGVRRTFAVAPERAWAVITSAEGIAAWLGDGVARLDQGVAYRAADGASGVVTVFKLGSHLRMTWQPGDWGRASTIQVRVIASGEKTVISFHQDHLPGAQERIAMRERWEGALERLGALLQAQVKQSHFSRVSTPR